MTVYAVFSRDYIHSELHDTLRGVFSTYELAEEKLSKEMEMYDLDPDSHGKPYIEGYYVDNMGY